MNIRKMLHVISVSSIEHLHSTRDHDEMIRMLISGESSVGEHAYTLADVLDATRRRPYAVLLSDILSTTGLTARLFEEAVVGLIDSKYLRWKGGGLVAAPFRMDWGRNAYRNVFVHRKVPAWSVLEARDRILRRPDDGSSMTPLHPHWTYLERRNLGVTSCTSNSGVRTGVSRITDWGPSGVRVGSLASLCRSRDLRVMRETPLLRKNDVTGVRLGSLASPKHENNGYQTDNGVSRITHIQIDTITGSKSRRRKIQESSLRSDSCREISELDFDPGQQPSAVDDSGTVMHHDSYPDTSEAKNPSMPSNTQTHDELEADWSSLESGTPKISQPTAGQEVARRGKQEAKPSAEPKAPKARRAHSERKKPVKLGDGDAEFVAVWESLRAAHERHDANGVAAEDGAFGAAGVGSRAAAWKAWAQLVPDERRLAARDVSRAIAFRASRESPPQSAMWYIRDRGWTRVSKFFVVPASASPRAAGPDSAPAVTAAAPETPWQLGVKGWLATGKAILLPTSRDPLDIDAWPVVDRERFVAALMAAKGTDRDKTLAGVTKHAPNVLPWIGEPPAVMHKASIPMATKLRAVVSQAQVGTAVPVNRKPARAVTSAAEIAAYCRSVGVDPDERYRRRP